MQLSVVPEGEARGWVGGVKPQEVKERRGEEEKSDGRQKTASERAIGRERCPL